MFARQLTRKEKKSVLKRLMVSFLVLTLLATQTQYGWNRPSSAEELQSAAAPAETLAAPAPVQALAADINLCQNPGFEAGTDKPDLWLCTGKGTGKVELDSTVKYEGEKSLKLTISSPSTNSAFVEQPIVLEPEKTYRMGVYYRTDSFSGNAFMQIQWKNSKNVNVLPSIVNYLKYKVGEWTYTETVFTAPKGAVKALVDLYALSTGSAEPCSIWFDSMSFTKVDLPVTLGINGGFEYGESSANLWWFTNVNATGGSWSFDADRKYEGSRSVRLTLADLTARGCLRHDVPVVPNKTYEFSSYYFSDLVPKLATRPASFLQIEWLDINGKVITGASNTSYCADKTTDWARKKLVGVAPPTAASAALELQAINGTGSVWFDNVSFRETNTSTVMPPYETFSSGSPADLTFITSLQKGASIAGISLYSSTPSGSAINVNPPADSVVTGSAITSTPTGGAISTGTTSGSAVNLVEIPMQPDRDYKINGYAITLNRDFLKTLEKGDYILGVKPSAGDPLTSDIEITDAAVAQEGNLVVNSGFETVSGFSLPRWTLPFIGASIDKNEKYEGSQSVALSLALLLPKQLQSDYIEVTPYSTYKISINYKAHELKENPYIKVEYFDASKTLINTTTAEGLASTDGWSMIYDERAMPANAKYIRLSAGATTGLGKVWFDNACVMKNNYLLNSSFNEGGKRPYFWSYDTDNTDAGFAWLNDSAYTKNSAVSMTKNSAQQIVLSSRVTPVVQNLPYGLTVKYRTEGYNGAATVKMNWYDEAGNLLLIPATQSSLEDIVLVGSAAETAITKRFTAPERAVYAIASLSYCDGSGSIIIDDIELRNTLTSGFGEIVPVHGVENISEPMAQNDFWNKFPKLPLKAPASSVWTIDPLRNFFFGVTQNVNDFVNFSVMSTERFNIIPALDKTINVDGGATGPYYVVANDIKYNPIASRYSGYTNVYYPRRIHDYMLTDFLPLYAVTGNQKYLDRTRDLMNFMMYEQWKEDGTNDFITDCFPDMAATKHPEWSGGWDDQFNFTWVDAYGYKWSPSEPDTHVNGQMVNAAITAYQQTKDARYLESVKKFLDQMLPRYGFHKGTWKNKDYYWTEYGPTGASKGICSSDATDNVNALVASALAEYAYYEPDPDTKARYLEFARGLIWYLVRELEYDNRFYYDGMENGIEERRAISHDLVVLNCSAMAITYMYKSGADVSELVKFYENAQTAYRNNWSVYQKMRYLRMFKLYDGTPEANKPLKFTTFANVIEKDLKDVKFKDDFSSADFVVPEKIDLRISRILNPDKKNANWRTDWANDVVLSVTPEQLKSGVIIPFKLKKGYVYKFTYELTATASFDRNTAVDYDSELFTWSRDVNNDAYFIRCTTGNVGDSTRYCLIPLKMDNKVNSGNFLSYAARYLFAFDEEVNAKLVDIKQPKARKYKDDANWSNIGANRYIYYTQSLTPNAQNSGKTLIADGFVPNRGRVYSSTEVGDFIEFNFESYLPKGDYNLSTRLATANNRAVVQPSIDGSAIGGEIDTYAAPQPKYQESPIVVTKDLGSLNLDKGIHSLRFTVTGKNANAIDYNIGITDALILTPAVSVQPLVRLENTEPADAEEND